MWLRVRILNSLVSSFSTTMRAEVLTPTWNHDQRVRAAALVAPAVSYLFGPGPTPVFV
ncbi:MAG: hypothetical protein JWN63_137 [Candidatus Acidoferrum typicum]|nr:hypothetical protein [Candidatus Acidoferrum typicum]